jgi:hypothetical protein
MITNIYESNIVSAINSDTWFGIFIRNLLNYCIETIKNNILSLISSYTFWATFFVIFFENLKKIFLTVFFVLRWFYILLIDSIINFFYPNVCSVSNTIKICEKLSKVKTFFKNLLIIGFAPQKALELRSKEIEAKKSRVFFFEEKNSFEKKNVKYTKVEPSPLEINKNILPSIVNVQNETYKYRYVKKGLFDTKIYYHCLVNRACVKNCFLIIKKNSDNIDLYISNKNHNHELL